MRRIIREYEQSARKRNYVWEIDEFQFIYLTQECCHYCGEPPSRIYNERCNGGWYYNGLDRVDNTKGYTLDNVVPCCWKCNDSKNNQNVDEWLDHVKRIVQYQDR